MIDFPYVEDICRPSPSKIVMLVVDGLGGLADIDTGKSELETAHLPNLDRLARLSTCGLTTPVIPGITPGSGPGHMSLFGYDPVKYLLGRGILEALGIEADLDGGDIAARGNFCTMNESGIITDRRAGRIDSTKSIYLTKLLNSIEIEGVRISVLPVQDHRFVLILQGENLGVNISGTDPQIEGTPPIDVEAHTKESQKTAAVVRSFVSQARLLLTSENSAANMVLLRGFSTLPNLPDFAATYKLRPAAIASYPMYRGLARVVNMSVLNTGQTFAQALTTLETNFSKYNFFFLHYKPADAAGEDGNFDAKVNTLQKLDATLPRIMDLQPDVLIVCGDHSTPAKLAAHSWHPVPVMIHSQHTLHAGSDSFSENVCAAGTLGRIQATDLMFLSLAHAGKLNKFGP